MKIINYLIEHFLTCFIDCKPLLVKTLVLNSLTYIQ